MPLTTKTKTHTDGHNININISNSQGNSGSNYSNGKEIVERNYVVALVLSIFLEWLGVDRFYANHVGLGLLKLFTFGAFGVWWLIDIIMFATKNVRYVKWVE
jgi:hypothetical protein